LESVSDILYELIVELQALASLKDFALAGGTGLALRFDHRTSVDIDLFSNSKIGLQGFKSMQEEIQQHFKDGYYIVKSKIQNPVINIAF